MLRKFIPLLVAVIACSRAETKVAAQAEPIVQPPQQFVDRTMPAVRLESAKTHELANVVNATLRVRPDRRFLIAVADVHELLTGKRELAEIAFAEGRWTVSAGGAEVGTLPELPTFTDGLELVTQLASRFQKESRRAAAPMNTSAFYATPLFEAATRGGDDRSLAEAAVFINVQTIDRFGLADPLRARALALLAIARAHDRDGTDDLAGLLADAFGYEREAHIPANLTAKAKAYLDARAALRRAEDHSEAAEPLLATLPARAMPLFLENTDMTDAVSFAHAAAWMVMTDASIKSERIDLPAKQFLDSDFDPDVEKLLSGYESISPMQAKKRASRAFPEDVVRAHYDALFYSALHELFDTMLDSYSSEPASIGVVESLERASTPLSRQVHQWMKMMVAAEYERGGDVPPDAAIARVPMLGAGARVRLLRSYSNALGVTEPRVRKAVQQLYPQLDSRPSEMLEAGRFAHRILDDPYRRELYFGAAIDRAPSLEDAGFRAWYYGLLGDEARLREIAESRDARPSDRATALSSLGEFPDADHDYVTSRFESLIRETGYSGVYSAFAKYINERRDWKTKERVIRSFFDDAKDRMTPIERAYYASTLGHALEQQGRYGEAWTIVEPHVEVWSANIVSEAVSLLERRGDVDRAIELGEQLIERYPGAGSRATVAAILWRRGRYDEAATLFEGRHRLAVSDMRNDLPQEFVDTFFGGSPTKAADAAEALSKTVEPYVVADIVNALIQEKQYEIAFAIADRLTSSPKWKATTPDGAGMHVRGWRALRAWKNADAATEWLQPRIPDAAVLQFVVIAYQDAEYELVWACASPRPDPKKNSEILSLLAASLTHMRVPANDPRRLELIEKIRPMKDSPGSLLPIARYLLGMLDEEAFLRWPSDADGRVTAAYFVGLNSAAHGDYDKALPWLLAASEGRESNAPRAWAIGMLWRWSAAKKSWKEIAQSGML